MENFLKYDELFYLNQIIADLYREDNKEKAFKEFLVGLKKLVFFEKGDVYFYRQENENIIFGDFFYVDWNDYDLNSYLHIYSSMDDVLPIVANKHPIMFRSTDVFIANERQKTQYYSELLNPAGMQYSIEGNIYISDDGNVGGIGIHRSSEYDDFTQKDLDILKLARPHLSNVAKVFCDNKPSENNFLSSIPFLSNLKDLGICIWDFDLKLLESNLEENTIVPIKHKEELIRSLITLCKGLRENIIRKSYSPEIESRMKSKISIGDKSYFADVAHSNISNKDKGRFIAIVYDYAVILSYKLSDIKDKYGLTDRESEIMQYLMDGLSNQEIASKLYISMPTVKKHLTSVYHKMGISGKSQMLNLVL